MFFRDEFRFLSNFVPAIVKIQLLSGEVVSCKTVEHGYQALKACTVEDQIEILSQTTPGKAKRAGKKVKLRQGWHVVKIDIMRKLLKQKFSIPEYRKKLLAVDIKIREDNNWHDNFWGVCLCGNCQGGLNTLGILLQQVKDDLMETTVQ